MSVVGGALGGCLLVAVLGVVTCIWYRKRRMQLLIMQKVNEPQISQTPAQTSQPQQVDVIVTQPEAQERRWLGTPAASTGAKGDEAANEGGGTQKAAAPQSLVALLAACGLEHRSKAFEDEEYTLENLLAAFKSGQAVAKGDLRELKLTLGECRQILNQLEATAA